MNRYVRMLAIGIVVGGGLALMRPLPANAFAGSSAYACTGGGQCCVCATPSQGCDPSATVGVCESECGFEYHIIGCVVGDDRCKDGDAILCDTGG